eukprot:g2174.t1
MTRLRFFLFVLLSISVTRTPSRRGGEGGGGVALAIHVRERHGENLWRRGRPWGLKAMATGDSTMTWGSEIGGTDEDMHVKLEGEDDESTDALEDEMKAMLEPANKMIAAMHEHLNMLLSQCAQLEADLEESKKKLDFEHMNQRALERYGFKEKNDSALDISLAKRAKSSVYDLLGSDFAEKALNGLPLDGLADALNEEGKIRYASNRTETDDERKEDMRKAAKQEALDILHTHAGFASSEATDAESESGVWGSRVSASEAEVRNETVAVEQCREDVHEMQRKLREAIAHLYPRNGSTPCPPFRDIVGTGSATKTKFVNNAGPECLAFLNASPDEIFKRMDANGDGRLGPDEYEAYMKAAERRQGENDEDEDPISPEDDPDMQTPPPIGCCDPFCLMRIRKFKVWAMRRTALVGKHLELLATKKQANVIQAKWPRDFKKIVRYWISMIFQTWLCRYKSKKGTCKTGKLDGYLDFICLYSTIEDKHFCNTKNLEVVQQAGVHEVAVRKICSLALLTYGGDPNFIRFFFDWYLNIVTSRMVAVLKVQKNPQTGESYLSPTFLKNPVVTRDQCDPMWAAQKEQAGKTVTSTVQSFKNSFSNFIDDIISWIKLFFKTFEITRQRNKLKAQIRPTTPLSNLINEATLQSLVEQASVAQWTWQEMKARECLAKKDLENVKSWSSNVNITNKYEKRHSDMKTEQGNAKFHSEKMDQMVVDMRETVKNETLGLIPPKEPFTVKPKTEEAEPMPLYTNYYNEQAIRCDNEKAFSLNPWDCVYFKNVDYQKSYLDMLDMDAQQTKTDANLLYGGMKSASLANARINFMRRIRWPWVPPLPICIQAALKKFPKPPQC